MSEEEKTIALMDQAKTFWNSPIGRWCDNRMNQIINDSFEQFKKVDPYDAKEVQRVQNEARLAEMLPDWITEIINEGYNLLQQIDSSDDVEDD